MNFMYLVICINYGLFWLMMTVYVLHELYYYILFLCSIEYLNNEQSCSRNHNVLAKPQI